MKKTQRYERRLAEAREGDLIKVLTEYKAEIAREKVRQNASHNAFVKTCCQQTIDQLMAEKRAIEDAVVGCPETLMYIDWKPVSVVKCRW